MGWAISAWACSIPRCGPRTSFASASPRACRLTCPSASPRRTFTPPPVSADCESARTSTTTSRTSSASSTCSARSRSRRLFVTITRRSLLAGTVVLPVVARAEPAYPTRPIRLIVPYPPGGGVDLTARLLMDPLAKELGQTIVVENKGGAGGLIGVEAMSHAAPDGYTMAVTGVSSMSAGPHLRGDKLPFDPMAFAHITRLVRMPLIFAVRNDLPAKTLPEFMALARKTEIRWASGGIGTSQHLAGELFTQMSGL